MKYAPFLVILLGCPEQESTDKNGDTAAGPDETGGPDDTGACASRLTSVDPAEGGVGVYYRDLVTLSFDGDGSTAAISVLDSTGTDAGMTPTWAAGNNMVTLEGGLFPSTDYTVHIELCGLTTETHFSTSADGSPLTIPVEDLIGRTYAFALADAEITEPAVLEMFDDSKLVTPLGFMVLTADATSLELLGGVLIRDEGDLFQAAKTDTWDFPASAFDEQPFFSTYIDSLAIVYSDGGSTKTTIQLYNFTLDGVFSADGSAITHGNVDTLVDTRNLGPLFGQGEALDAVCLFAETFAVYCIACPDDEMYCLHTIGEDIYAPWVEGLELEPYPASE